VGGAVTPREGGLDVRVDVRNAGEQPVSNLTVLGEVFRAREEGRHPGEIPPGKTVSVVLRFPDDTPRPGAHAVRLRLEYAEGTAPDASGNVVTASEPACLLFARGQDAPAAVRVSASPVTIDALGALPVTLESQDGEAHRVRLRALTSRTLIAEDPAEIEVPARGTVRVAVPLRRAGALRGSRPGVWLVAEAVDGPVARTSVAAADVTIAKEPGLLPRMRVFLFVLGGLLVAGALLFELGRPMTPPAVA
jgi:hypothetical protein